MGCVCCAKQDEFVGTSLGTSSKCACASEGEWIMGCSKLFQFLSLKPCVPGGNTKYCLSLYPPYFTVALPFVLKQGTALPATGE